MKGVLDTYLPRSQPETEEQIAMITTQFSHGIPFPLLKSHSKMGNQKARNTFPDLNEVVDPLLHA